MANEIGMPNVYRGTQRLATADDLYALEEKLKSIIKGPNEENVSDAGYVPLIYDTEGKLDVELLFPELIEKINESNGVIISQNGVQLTSPITTINFTGNYVYFDKDLNGNLTIDIRPPRHEVSKFNLLDGSTDSLVRIKNEIVKNMIIPNVKNVNGENNLYGDWAAGEVHEGFNWNGEDKDLLILYTEGEVWAADDETYFEVSIINQENICKMKFISHYITGKNPNGLFKRSGHGANFVSIKVPECSTAITGEGLMFKPVFEINMVKFFEENIGRFRIEIEHKSNDVIISRYVSKDYFYNHGRVPELSSADSFYGITNALNSTNSFKSKFCSGLEYIENAEMFFGVSSIRYLNSNVAIQQNEIMSYGFDDSVELVNGSLKNYSLDKDCQPSWSISIYPKKNMFINETISGWITAKNIFGESKMLDASLKLLINTKLIEKESDGLNEYFNDENYRLKNSFETSMNDGITSYSKWDSKLSLIEEDQGTGLMVVPSVGLRYPYNDWSGYTPKGPNYNDGNGWLANEKYFSRVFIASDQNMLLRGSGQEKVRFGGIFHFEGISKDEFLKSVSSCIISCDDRGLNWYSLLTIRNKKCMIKKSDGSKLEATGILTDIIDVEDGVDVIWSYPKNEFSKNPLKFRIGMMPSATAIIKSISLKSLDGQEEW